MRSLDFSRFENLINRNDVGRSNLFHVAFNDVSFNITKDGVIDFAEPEINEDANDSGIRDGISSVRSRVQDTVTRNLERNSNTFRKLQGVYSPRLLRLAFGDDIVDNLINSKPDINRDIAMMCKSVTAPSVGFDTEKSFVNKKPFTVIKARNQGDVTMTFYASATYIERQFFLSWMNAIHDPYTNEYGFFNSYAKDFDIYTYKRNGRVGSLVHIQDAVPTNVGEITFDWEGNNQVAVFTVTFSCSVSSHISDPNIGTNLANAFDSARSIIGEVDLIRRGGGGDI